MVSKSSGFSFTKLSIRYLKSFWVVDMYYILPLLSGPPNVWWPFNVYNLKFTLATYTNRREGLCLGFLPSPTVEKWGWTYILSLPFCFFLSLPKFKLFLLYYYQQVYLPGAVGIILGKLEFCVSGTQGTTAVLSLLSHSVGGL